MEVEASDQLTGDLAMLLNPYRRGHLATADASAAPHLIPICFVCDCGTIYSAIDHKPKRMPGYRMKRVRNMLENPQVAFLVDHYEDDWEQLSYVMIRGRASILDTGAERQRALGLLEAKYPQYQQRQLAQSTGLVIKIVPESVNQWQWR
jgi:PPOX class probable F420-dependent enzyme